MPQPYQIEGVEAWAFGTAPSDIGVRLDSVPIGANGTGGK
jgi:hypothetical protein